MRFLDLKRRGTAPFIADDFFYGWFSFLWSFYSLRIVMKNICYIVFHFFCIATVNLLQSLRLSKNNSVLLLILKKLTLIVTKKLRVRIAAVKQHKKLLVK